MNVSVFQYDSLFAIYDLVTNSSSLVFVGSLKVCRLLKYSLYWKAFADFWTKGCFESYQVSREDFAPFDHHVLSVSVGYQTCLDSL